MTNAKRKPLGLTAGAVVVISVAVQTLVVALSWWDFDPRLSCDRLLFWGEWIECLHGTSHQYVHTLELAVGSWIVGGVAMLLGRFVPPYISVLPLAASVMAFILFLVDFWHTALMPYWPFGEPALQDIFHFAIVTGPVAVFVVGPVVGAWLFGLSARERNLR